MKKSFYTKLLSCSILLSPITSCNNYDDDIKNLGDRVTALETSVVQLKAAYEAGKIISNVFPSSDGKGYDITFSDGSVITIRHGVDGNNGSNGANGVDGIDGQNGVTPIVQIDSDGYWIVSYDDGGSFSRILDKDGNPVIAVVNGKDGADGNDGKDGNCVRVVIDENGNYAFEIYSPSDPEVVISTISTSFSSNPASVISSIVKDENNGTVVLTMADGSLFTFNLDVAYPTGIVLLSDVINIHGKDRKDTFEFRLNPSTSYINFVYDGDNPNIQLDQISVTRADADSYVTVPSNYRIVDVAPSLDKEGRRKVGQYTVTVSSDVPDVEGEEKVMLVITTKDGMGNKVQLSSSLMTVSYDTRPNVYGINVGGIEAVKADDSTFYVKLPYGSDVKSLPLSFDCNGEVTVGEMASPETIDLSNPAMFTVTFNGAVKEFSLIAHYSDLPIIYVNTPAPIESKDEWVKKSTIQVANAGVNNGIYEQAQMKGRGNSTWKASKKPYAIKLDKKAGMLGMPAHKRWVLLANYYDKTDLRTEAAMNLGRRTGLDYTPRTTFVEFVLNGEFQGLYQFTEQMKIDENRVNVGDDGFLLEVDNHPDEDEIRFTDDYVPQPIIIKDPDVEAGSEDYEFIKSYIASVSSALNTLNEDGNNTQYLDLIDLRSFVDWYLVNEITRNNDACFFSSCYMNLKRGDKLKMGPLWDFDLAIGNSPDNDSENPIGFWLKRKIPWYVSLFKSPTFIKEVKLRFNQLYLQRGDLYKDIRGQRDVIREAYIGNEMMWNFLEGKDKPNEISPAFDKEVEGIIDWLEIRFEWMKSEFDNL